VAGHVVGMENQNLRLPRQGNRGERKEKSGDQKGGQPSRSLFSPGNPGFQIYHLLPFLPFVHLPNHRIYFRIAFSIRVGGIHASPLRSGVGEEFHHLGTDLIPQFPEEGELLLSSARENRGIGETHVDSPDSAEENRTAFRGVITQGYDEIEFLIRKLIEGLGSMPGNVDSRFLHRGNGQGMNEGGIRAGREGVHFPRQVMVDQPLCHLAPGAVMGADKENPFHNPPFYSSEPKSSCSLLPVPGFRLPISFYPTTRGPPTGFLRSAREMANPRGSLHRVGEIFSFEPQGHVHQADPDRHLQQGADDRRKGLAGVDPEYGHGYRDGQLEVVRGGGEAQGGDCSQVASGLINRKKGAETGLQINEV
jgi:hypothetical protein